MTPLRLGKPLLLQAAPAVETDRVRGRARYQQGRQVEQALELTLSDFAAFPRLELRFNRFDDRAWYLLVEHFIQA